MSVAQHNQYVLVFCHPCAQYADSAKVDETLSRVLTGKYDGALIIGRDVGITRCSSELRYVLPLQPNSILHVHVPS